MYTSCHYQIFAILTSAFSSSYVPSFNSVLNPCMVLFRCSFVVWGNEDISIYSILQYINAFLNYKYSFVVLTVTLKRNPHSSHVQFSLHYDFIAIILVISYLSFSWKPLQKWFLPLLIFYWEFTLYQFVQTQSHFGMPIRPPKRLWRHLGAKTKLASVYCFDFVVFLWRQFSMGPYTGSINDEF